MRALSTPPPRVLYVDYTSGFKSRVRAFKKMRCGLPAARASKGLPRALAKQSEP
jgi:hypothetical protein